MSKKQIDIYRTGIYLRLSQGDEDIDGLEKKESNSHFQPETFTGGIYRCP